jgi:hypothetical protein
MSGAGTSLDDQAWENLKAIPTVISLHLANNPLPAGPETFHVLAHVEELYLTNCALYDHHFEGIADMPSLESLTIINCDLSRINLSVLGRSSSVSQLLLYRTSCSPEAIEQLRKLMPQCSMGVAD